MRRRVLTVAAALALSALVVVLVGRAVGYAKLADRLGDAEWAFIAFAVAGELVAYAGYAFSYQGMAAVASGPRLGLRDAAHAMAISMGAFAAATALGGMSVDYWALRQAGEPPPRAGARVLALQTLRWAVLSTWVVAAAVVLLVRGEAPAAMCVAWIVLVPACYAGGAWVSAPRRRDRLGEDAGSAPRRAFALAVRALVLIRAAVHARDGRRAVAGVAVYWIGDLLCLWAAVRAFGTSLAPDALIVAYATGYAASALPLPAGGAGGIDAAMTFALHAVGVELEVALLGTLAFRLVAFWLPLLPALPAAAGAPALARRLHRVAATAPEDICSSRQNRTSTEDSCDASPSSSS